MGTGRRSGTEGGARARGRLRRRLRDGARVAPSGESCGRRALDGRHGRDPAAAAAKAGRVRPPLVYIAIGLPERLARLRSERMRRAYARALASTAAVAAYSEHEASELLAFMAEHGESTRRGVRAVRRRRARVRAVTRAAVSRCRHGRRGPASRRRPVRRPRGRDAESDVSSRDDAGSGAHVRSRRRTSPSRSDISFADMKLRLEEARVVALPVRDNSYSGATTVLLQAMALGKPVVVSRTKAIASGYGLVDGDNCRLVEPGDADGVRSCGGDGPPRRVARACARSPGAAYGRGGAHVGPVRRPDRVDPQRRIRSNPLVRLPLRSVHRELEVGYRCVRSLDDRNKGVKMDRANSPLQAVSGACNARLGEQMPLATPGSASGVLV